MKRFFRFLFRAELEKLTTLSFQLENESRARQALEISNASLQRENDFLREKMDEAIKNERYALQTQANIATQSQYGIKPYPGAPGLPEASTEPKKASLSIPTQGVDIHRNATANAVTAYDEEAARRGVNGEPMPMTREHLLAIVGGVGKL